MRSATEEVLFEETMGTIGTRKARKTTRRTPKETRSPCQKIGGKCRWRRVKCSMKARSRRHGEEACRLWRTTKRRTSSMRRETTEVRREDETQGRRERSATESQVVGRSTAQLRNKQCASTKGCGAQEIAKGFHASTGVLNAA